MVFSPWYWRSQPLEKRTGSDIFRLLFLNNSSIATLLESPFPTIADHPELCRYSICAGKPRIVDGKKRLWIPPLGKVFSCLNELFTLSKGYEKPSFLPEDFPFNGGCLGWLGYDLAWEVENLPNFNRDSLPFPVAYWYEPESFAVLDHQQQILWLASTEEMELDILQAKLKNVVSVDCDLLDYGLTEKIEFITDQESYENNVRKAKKYIEAGDIFQTNLSLRFSTYTALKSWHIYQNLHKINPSPFASYWQTPWGDLISCSPERLIQKQGKKVQTRPIAGTRARGKNKELDLQLERELLANMKEQAEHIMLVDLERNDLGKVCDWGTVEVDEFLTIERYSHVMHLVSNVRGILNRDYNIIDLIKGVFPGGTITGCPKVRCMEIIEELEPVKRNLFYGSCGYLDYGGNVDLNILIRTLLIPRIAKNNLYTQVWGQVGAGIVADSDPHREWIESLHKAQAQLSALSFIV
jgi:para-aminobenzoate synthetase component I